MQKVSITKRLEHERVQIDCKHCPGLADLDLEISGFRGFYNLLKINSDTRFVL